MAESAVEVRPRLRLREPRAFRAAALLRVHAYGLFLVLPFLAAAIWLSVSTASMYALVPPFLALVFTCALLPLGLGNLCIRRLVERRLRRPEAGATSFVVQMTATPRLRDGLRAVLEDADDVGWLTADGSELCFNGDSVDLAIPRESISAIRLENVGLRTVFVYGPRLRLEIRGLDEIDSIEFAERSSLLLPTSRRTARRMRQAVTQWWKATPG